MVEAAGVLGAVPRHRTEKVLADKRARPAYHAAMNTLRLLIGIAMVGAIHHPAFADQVNLCKDANGRQTMTDRPCGDPSITRSQGQRPAQIIVEQIQADDIFRARTKIRENGTAVSPGIGEGADALQGQNRSDVLRQSW